MGCGPSSKAAASPKEKVPSQRLSIIDETNYETNEIKKRYRFLDVIASGFNGKVFKSTKISGKLDEDRFYAIKILSKKTMKKSYEKIMQEIIALKKLDHPNVVKYHETYEDEKNIYFVMEYCSGGDLYDRITNMETTFTEEETALIMEKLFLAINHCHYNGVVHRDIKPENIMYSSSQPKSEVKLIDFGLAKVVHQSELHKQDLKLETVVGTPYYVAPEVLLGDYSKSCDIWSLGVIMYLLLSGELPFGGDNTPEIFKNLRKGQANFDGEVWNTISEDSKALLKRILNVDIKSRPSAFDVLKDSWFSYMKTRKKKKIPRMPSIIDPGIIRSLRGYKTSTRFQKAAMNVLVKGMSEAELKKLRKIFQKFDTEHKGVISFVELEQSIRELGTQMPADEIHKIISNVDYAGNGMINYSEFLSATISTFKLLTEENLWPVFRHFDVDNTGYLTGQNIKEAMKYEGKDLEDTEINDVFNKYNTTGDGKMQFQEFKAMLEGIQEVREEDDEEGGPEIAHSPYIANTLNNAHHFNNHDLDPQPDNFL